jgi:hypothetical protein
MRRPALRMFFRRDERSIVGDNGGGGEWGGLRRKAGVNHNRPGTRKGSSALRPLFPRLLRLPSRRIELTLAGRAPTTVGSNLVCTSFRMPVSCSRCSAAMDVPGIRAGEGLSSNQGIPLHGCKFSPRRPAQFSEQVYTHGIGEVFNYPTWSVCLNSVGGGRVHFLLGAIRSARRSVPRLEALREGLSRLLSFTVSLKPTVCDPRSSLPGLLRGPSEGPGSIPPGADFATST